jgi:myo-inositol-1(or 4)-monophosphatase
MATRSAVINVMARAADKAARALKRDFGEVEQLQVSVKGPADFVSQADIRAERAIKDELRRARPGFGFLMEESGASAGEDPDHRWIVDPLDGTTNFLHGIPHFAISIALESKGEMTAGIVFDPLKDELFWAEKGGGAYLNNRRLRVSSRKHLGESLIATGIPFLEHGDHATFLAELGRVMPAVSGVRRGGAAALDLAYVAAGRYDAFWERGLQPWDFAAGIVLVREAGGFVSEIGGGAITAESRSLIACNEALGNSVRDLLTRA